MSDLKKRLASSGLSIEEISEKSGLTTEKISSILNGEDYSLFELRKLTSILGLRASDLSSDKDQQKNMEFLFRQVISKNKSVSERSTENLSSFLSSALKFSTPIFDNVNWIDSFKGLRNETAEDAEFLAEKFRAIYFKEDLVSPLVSLPQLVAEKLGVFLFVVSEKDIEGASVIMGGRAFIFLSSRSFAPRMLFTLAHELGHLVSGHFKGKADAFIDEEGSIGGLSKNKDRSEYFADHFASSLLMPAKSVGISLQKIRNIFKKSGPLSDVEILLLSRIYGVSFEVAARRCEDLQLLPSGGARSLYDYLVKNFGSPEKRADMELPPRPDIKIPRVPNELIEAAISKINSGQLSVGKASEMLRLTITDLYGYNNQSFH